MELCLEPLLRVATGVSVAPQAVLDALIEAAEALAATDELSGPARLWAAEEGEALATLLTTARSALAYLPDQPPSALPGLLDAMLEGEMVRTRRALRGRNAAEEHPRVFIWGLLEARLQSVETIVLGGLAETVWPPATDPGPWMSRPMRARAGLPSPEERVGQAAHDFVMAACAAPIAVLSCPRRRDSAPSVPARWLARIDIPSWPGSADPCRATPPPNGHACSTSPQAGRALCPARGRSPALALRPRRLRVTDVQTWLESLRHLCPLYVLKLNKLRPLEEATDAADYGSLVHRGLELFFAEHGHTLAARRAGPAARGRWTSRCGRRIYAPR